MYTWVKVFGARVSAAQLDRFYMSRNQSNRLLGTTILLVGFLDHHITMARLSISPGPWHASFWKFNVKMPLFAQVSRLFEKVGVSEERGISESMVGCGKSPNVYFLSTVYSSLILRLGEYWRNSSVVSVKWR